MTFLTFITWPLFPHLGVEAPFGSSSTSLSFRTMIWSYWVNIDVSLKGEKAFSFPSHRFRSPTPLTFQFILPELTLRWEGLFLMPQLAQGVHLLLPGRAEDFQSCLYLLAHRGLRSVLAYTRSKARRTSSVLACTCSKARKTSSCLHSLKGEEDLFLPALTQRQGGLLLASRRTRALRSLVITGASDRRKTMKTLKL